MSGYENSLRQDFTVTGLTNAAVAAAAAIRIPPTARFAFIEDIQLFPTTAIVNTTTPGKILIGTPGAPGKFASQSISSLTGLAVGSAYGVSDSDGRVAAYNPAATPSATNKCRIDLQNDGDTVGTQLAYLVIGTAAGTGTPAGVYTATFTVRWF